ncbi:hypothetical protein KEM56_004251 [Ascosphaera pollenicola]|nr:hypothetical protein KEM56_004251 [Ascosphaera pollenicola]
MRATSTQAQTLLTRGMEAYDDNGRLSDLIQVLLELDLYEKYSPSTWKNLDRDVLSRYIRHDGYAILDIHRSLRNDILDTLHERIKAVDDEARDNLDKWREHQMVFTTKRRGCIPCMRNQEVVEDYEYTGKVVRELCGTCRSDELCSLYDLSSDINDIDSE